jgi:hypothetical protein
MAAGDVRQQYRASANQTVTALASLAASSSLMAGWTSSAISNATDKDLDHIISGQITVGAGPTAGEIRLYAYARMDDATWPDLFSSGTEGSQGAATLNDSTGVRDAGMRLLWAVTTDADASRVYPITPTSLLERLGYMPEEYALFVTHSTVQALAASGQQITIKGVSAAVAQS